MRSFITLALTVATICLQLVHGFNMSSAQTNCLLSFAAYCGNNVGPNFDCYWCSKTSGFTWIGNFGNSSDAVFGFVGIMEPEIKVVFRGTDNTKGWLADFTFFHTNYDKCSGCDVHKGFYTTYNSQNASIKALVSTASTNLVSHLKHCPSCYQLTVTGHSLGAALATLAAVDLATTLPYSSLLVFLENFGSPRVGNAQFADYAATVVKYIYRHTTKADPVPKVPLPVMGYRHDPQEIWYNGSTYVTCSPTNGEDPNCSNSMHIPNVLDHAFYMGFDVLLGVPHGCLYTDP